MDHGRLHWYLPSEMNEAQRAYYDRLLSGPRDHSSLLDEDGRLEGAFNARLLDPAVGTAIQELAATLRFGHGISDRLREITILEVASLEHCQFEWQGHAAIARTCGLTEDQLDAIRLQEQGTFEPQEQLVRAVAQCLFRTGDLPEELYRDAVEELGATQLFNVVTLVAHYRGTAMALRVWRVPLRQGGKSIEFAGARGE